MNTSSASSGANNGLKISANRNLSVGSSFSLAEHVVQWAKPCRLREIPKALLAHAAIARVAGVVAQAIARVAGVVAQAIADSTISGPNSPANAPSFSRSRSLLIRCSAGAAFSGRTPADAGAVQAAAIDTARADRWNGARRRTIGHRLNALSYASASGSPEPVHNTSAREARYRRSPA